MGRSRARYVQKSCRNCREEKRKCSEGITCKRCSDRGRECKRDWDSKKRGRKKNNTDGNSGNNMTDEAIFILGDNNPLAIPPVTEVIDDNFEQRLTRELFNFNRGWHW
nr:11889_t:CDS:2 [Entrophospora candida]